ncbi:MAG TPA: ATP-binding protein [Pseudonocardiaceae bacterium]|jgi:two-component system OmpR family sensor kinase|nr:ATP-binding protein [Pseudonocardiaceae bacterium]
MTVTVLGLAAADVVGVTALQSYLDQQTDSQINIVVGAVRSDLTTANELPYSVPGDATNCAVVITDAAGGQLSRLGSTDAVPTPPIQQIRRYAAIGAPVTIDDAGGPFRVQVATASGGRYLIVSESLKWSEAVLSRLVVIELVVTLMTLVLAALLATGVSRFVLRPLDRMSATAAGIADGELSQRVDLGAAPTEVASVAQSMNQMLSRIQQGFTQRRIAQERLRQFVADASHELRTPLTAITGYAQLVRKGAVSDPRALDDAMRRVEDEAKRMASLVDELLLLARLDQERSQERSPLDLAELVTLAVEDAGAADQDRTLSLVVEAGEHTVLGDEHRLRQVMGNLLANVRAHTPPGAPAEVRVSSDGPQRMVNVIDSGPGISAEARELAFERFYRADSARSRVAGRHDGSGLGLSIVLAIAQAHNGTARALPHAGGAWLRLTIPSIAPTARPGHQDSDRHVLSEF